MRWGSGSKIVWVKYEKGTHIERYVLWYDVIVMIHYVVWFMHTHACTWNTRVAKHVDNNLVDYDTC